jgi:hypothetical protein
MSSTDFAKTMTARARARGQILAMDGRGGAVRDQVGASLERRIESVRRAARAASQVRSRSRISQTLPNS